MHADVLQGKSILFMLPDGKTVQLLMAHKADVNLRDGQVSFCVRCWVTVGAVVMQAVHESCLGCRA